MRIKINTTVQAGLERVKAGFTKELFLSLNPPFPPVKLKHFGGCVTGDQVILELNFLLFKQLWVSDITDDSYSENRWYFIDRGVQLPFFLSAWQHHHIVDKKGEKTVITDDISFSTGTLVTDVLMYPLLYFQFLYRKPIYKKIFKKK